MPKVLRKSLTIILFLLTFGLVNCRQNGDKWQAVKQNNLLSISNTHCMNEGQTWEKAQVYFDADTLIIAFPAQLPGYWENVTVKVHNGNFCAETSGIPFAPFTIDFQTKNQQLQLNKRHYAIGDTLRAVCDFIFQYIAKPQETEGSKTKYEVIFQGTVCEIVRPQDFDPFDKKNFMTFDLPTAIHELGEPFNREKYNAKQLYGEFRVILLNHLKPDPTVWIEELTWDISPTRDVSDEGKERLTIWYLQKDSANWQPVDFLHWNSNMQF